MIRRVSREEKQMLADFLREICLTSTFTEKREVVRVLGGIVVYCDVGYDFNLSRHTIKATFQEVPASSDDGGANETHYERRAFYGI